MKIIPDVASEGGFLVSKIHHIGQRIFRGLLQSHGIVIGSGHGKVIYTLWKEDGISISTIANKTSLSKSTLTETLDKMEDEGYIERRASRKDRRVTLIHLTDDAKRMNQKFDEVSQLMTKIFYKNFTDNEVLLFEKSLKKILKNLREYEITN